MRSEAADGGEEERVWAADERTGSLQMAAGSTGPWLPRSLGGVDTGYASLLPGQIFQVLRLSAALFQAAGFTVTLGRASGKHSHGRTLLLTEVTPGGRFIC